MAEHTTGLRIVRSKATRWDMAGDFGLVDAEGKIVGEAFATVDYDTRRPAEANARLWSAAPLLLEACWAALVPAGDTPEQVADLLRAAIDAATKEAPNG